MSSSCRRRWVRIFACVGTVWLASGGAVAGELPPENRCPTLRGGPGTVAGDVGGPVLRSGTVIGMDDLPTIESLLPEPVWTYRDAFFFEGMRLEVGPCHRRFPVSKFFADATHEHSHQVRLDDEGNLIGLVAGLPFPPGEIDEQDPNAALKWAWNFAHRYRGAGPVGSFRLVDMSSRKSSPMTYLGNFFILQTGHRADLMETDYRTPESTRSLFVAGGRFTEPFSARHLAWRQIRPRKADRRFREADDTFVYVPTMRKSRRAATAWVDGIYTPRYTVSGDDGGGPVPYGVGGNEYGAIESIQPTAGLSIAASEDIRRGFTGLTLRPNAYEWKYLGEREVLAPLNGRTEGFPQAPERNFGPMGLSVASDRWDVRYAVVIEGTMKRSEGSIARVRLYIDYQTQQPLYYVSRRKNGFLLDVGILVHRFSGDQGNYPSWDEEHQAYAFDPVASAFYYVPGGGSGWRRESYDVVSVPLDPKKMRRLTSTDALLRGH